MQSHRWSRSAQDEKKRLRVMEGRSNLFNVRSVRSDCFMKFIAAHTEFLGPVSDVRTHLGINFFLIVRAFSLVFVNGVRLVGFLDVVLLGHANTSFSLF